MSIYQDKMLDRNLHVYTSKSHSILFSIAVIFLCHRRAVLKLMQFRNWICIASIRSHFLRTSRTHIVNHTPTNFLPYINWLSYNAMCSPHYFMVATSNKGNLKLCSTKQALKDHSTYVGCHCIMLGTKLVMVKCSQKSFTFLFTSVKFIAFTFFIHWQNDHPKKGWKKFLFIESSSVVW